MPVAAHSPYLPAGISQNHRIVRDVAGDHSSRPYKSVAPDGNAAYDGGIRADCAPSFKTGGFVERAAVDLAPRVTDIGQHTAGAKKYLILNFAPLIDGDVVLHLHPVADFHIGGNKNILSENTAGACLHARGEMTEMPHSGPLTQNGPFIHIGRLMYLYIVVCFHIALFKTLAESGWTLPRKFEETSMVRNWCTSSMEALASSIPKPCPASVRS